MYKLLLVDDESDIRDGLREVIRFEDHGFTVVGEAANGLEALQAAQKLRPDLIITDIRMPLMDGLTLCRRVQKELPTTRFIILSGYDDFEYARQAIAINCLGYLLKPISSSEFRDMLQEAKTKLDEEFAQRRNLTRLKEHFRTSLPRLREDLLSSLLSGGLGEDEALVHAQRYELPLYAPQYALALIRPQSGSESSDVIGDPELLGFAVINIAQEILSPHATAHVFHYHGLLAALILLDAQGEDAFSSCVGWLEEARKTIDYYLHTRVLIGVSAPMKKLDHLVSGARQALSALDQCSIWEDQQLLCVTDLEPGSLSELAISDLALRRLSNALKLGQMDAIEGILKSLMDACRESKPTPKMYKGYLLEIFMTLMHTARDMSLDFEMGVHSAESSLEAFMRCPPPDQAYSMLLALCGQFSASIQENRASSSRLLAREAADYLEGHYADQALTIEKLCGRLHISPSYFSVLFKKETKKTFVQYLTELRMDKAMTLLTGSEMKTIQIAEAVGIPDPSYFSYSFKKHFGISPSQARKRGEGSL
jgi:two-component system response regulator YesN